jgi:hypothetical protein
MLAAPPVGAWRWTDTDVTDRAQEDYARVVRDLNALAPADGEYGPQPIAVGLTADARDVLIAFIAEAADQWDDCATDAERGAAGKARGLAVRVGLVVACIRAVTGDGPDDVIDAEAMSAGVEVARWAVAEAIRVYAALGGGEDAEASEADQERERLLGWIRGRGGRCTVRDLAHGPREYRGEATRAKGALDDLIAAGAGRWEPGPGGRTLRFVLFRTGPTGPGSSSGLGASARWESGTGATGASAPDPAGTPAGDPDGGRTLRYVAATGGDTGDGDTSGVPGGARRESVAVAGVASVPDDGDDPPPDDPAAAPADDDWGIL